MTAREIMDKHPAVEALVEETVKHARDSGMSDKEGVALLARKMKARGMTSKKLPIGKLAEEFWIA